MSTARVRKHFALRCDEPFELSAERIVERREILERADQRRERIAEDTPSPLTMLSIARAERDEDFGRLAKGTAR